MCGIAGYIHPEYYNLDDTLKLIKHRGPDGQGIYYDHAFNKNLGLGHVRLSIIDLSDSANQPLISADNNYIIVFNGEIYNYQELKDRYLIDYHFLTSSDTEVIVALYRKFGAELFKLLDGMFALAIYDKVKQEVVFARDQLGIKPLYISRDSKGLFFSSEIKVFNTFNIKPEVDETAITEFLLNGFIYEPGTGFKNITKLPAGHYLRVNLQDANVMNCEPEVFWHPVTSKVPSDPKKLAGLIDDSVHHHLVADVPIGLFFSGGVDSSILLLKTDNTVESMTVKSSQDDLASAGMSDDYYYSKLIASDLNRNVVPITLNDSGEESLLKEIYQVVIGNEELISDYTFLASRKISLGANRLNKKVVLSGMGADELFGGYPRYQMLRYYKAIHLLLDNSLARYIINRLRKRPRFAKKIDRLISFTTETEFIYKYSSLVGVFSRTLLKQLIVKEHQRFDDFEQKMAAYLSKVDPDLSPLKKGIYLDLYGFLAHNFSVADKSSMAASIEMRVPLATHKLFNYGFNLHDEMLVNKGVTKVLLKSYLKKFLPAYIVNRQKAGFNPPLDNKINQLNSGLILDLIHTTPLLNYVEIEELKKILSNHFSKRKNNTYLIYNLLYLGVWLKENLHTE